MKKKKSFKKVVSLALAAILTAVPVLSTAMVAKAANPVILAPSNMVQFDIVDEDGNALNGVAYTITNSAGVKVAGFSSSGSFTSYNLSDIESEDTFTVWIEDFEPIVAPAKLDTVTGMRRYDYEYGTTILSNFMELSSGQEEDIKLYIMPEKEIALTVPANTIMVNVDSQWANGATKHILTANGQDYAMNNMAGTLTSVPMPADGNIDLSFYYGYNPFTGGQQQSYESNYTLSTEQTEYIKVRMKASELAYNQYNDKGVYIHDGKEIAIASGQSNPGESMLWIVSGSVINMPVPDANGYIEFYVENTQREYEYEIDHCGWSSTMSWGGGGTHGSSLATEPLDMTVRAVDFPTDMNYMTYVPADTYTIDVTKVPEGYEVPDPITFTVQNSQQFQTAKIVVENAHTHSYGTTYESDADNHWNECACGAEGNIAAHTPGPAATEQRAQTCTVCGYEIAPMLQHTHSYGTAYESDADNHWNTCACGATGNVAAHVPGPAATEQSAQTCTVCGYEIAPMLQHTHSYGTAYESDADNHWNECACGADGNVAAHSFEWITDKPATTGEAGSKHEECSVCGYEKAPVEIPKLTTGGNNNTNTNTNTNNAGSAPVQNPVTEEVKDDVPKTGDSPVIPLAVAGCIVALGGIAVLIYFKKKENA